MDQLADDQLAIDQLAVDQLAIDQLATDLLAIDQLAVANPIRFQEYNIISRTTQNPFEHVLAWLKMQKCVF